MSVIPLSANERFAVEQRLPDAPIQADPATTAIRRFEVVVAYNLDPPYRYAQEFFWLEILAVDERAAVEAAERWVIDVDDHFEATDLVRQASHHERVLAHSYTGLPLEVAWNLPVLADDPDWQPLRSPVSGTRIGFLSDAVTEQRWLTPEAAGRFRLVMRKPSTDSEALFVAPIVYHGRPSN
jgi:hypothetical protein